MTQTLDRPAPREGPEPDGAEEVPVDDAVIGRAFRRSLGVLLVLGSAAGAAALWLGPKDAPPPQPAPTIAAPSVQPDAEAAPDLPFTEVTRAAGIDFVHRNGARGGKYLPETMGSGCAFFDHDGDGAPDLLLVDGAPWPWDRTPGAPPEGGTALYVNDGSGRFTRSEQPAFDPWHFGMGAAIADADADGDPDVLVTGVGGNRFYRNDEGRYVDATDASGLRGPEGAWTTSAGFADLDGDGDLDLVVCAYVRWSKSLDEDQNYTLKGVGRAYGPPTSFEGVQCFVYRNDGGLRFTDVSAECGIEVRNPATGVPVGKALGLCFLDPDEDGDLDIFIANDTVRNFLFRNDGRGRFEEVGEAAGIAYDSRGASTGAMGADVGDPRNDGGLAIAVGNFASEMSSLYWAARGTPRFTDVAIAEGIGAPSRKALSFGVLFFDADLDGRLDLFQTNGHLEQEIHRVQPSQSYEQESQLFWNQGPRARQAYALVPAPRVKDLARPVVGRAAAPADVDGDGDLDLVITQSGRAPLLLRNDQALGHHWLRVRLVGAGANRDAIGARIELVAGGEAQRRMVMPTRSYLAQVPLPVTFGLGRHPAVDRLEVTWPDGQVTVVEGAAPDREIKVRHPDAR